MGKSHLAAYVKRSESPGKAGGLPQWSYLVEHPDRLVTKEELLQAVWPNTYVSEGLLSTYIRDLRAVLGDDPAAPRFIETVVRRGYRFIARAHHGCANCKS